MRFSLLTLLAMPALAFALSACSSDAAGTSCDSSDDCERGLSCLEDGSCGVYSCTAQSDCLQQGEFQETCMFDDGTGAYAPSGPGVCTDQECRSDRDCEGGQCIDSVCYSGTSGPISCECRDDCPTGDACIAGLCRAPAGVCSSNCDCAMGTICEAGACVAGTDPCDGVTCSGGQTCVEGACVGGGTCDPACGAGEVCNAATNTCEPAGNVGQLCSPCTTDDECGGAADACVALSGGSTVCGQSCGDTAPCPGGYVCVPVDTRVGSQCLPAAAECAGCLVSGCADGQFCDPSIGSCVDAANICDSCRTDAECAEGICAAYGGGSICLDTCAGGTGCGAGFECVTVDGTEFCAPTDGGCGDSSCPILPGDCTAPLEFLNTDRCVCVGCLSDTDCDGDLVCSAGGNCIAGGRPCSTTAECDGGYCQGGYCVDCLTPGDCSDDEVCTEGQCVSCECAVDERCNAAGECVEIPDPTNCTSDSQCAQIARDLGFSGEGATCDSTIGCYTIGSCNGSGGGGLPGFEDLDFGGETDPFDAPCPAGTTCTAGFDLLGMMGGSPSFFTFSCGGCDETNPDACREGESCAAPLFDISGAGPSCGSGGGGIPGFPF